MPAKKDDDMSNETANSSFGNDARFVIITSSLLLLVIALLAGLWLRMRTRALRAEQQVARLVKTQQAGAGVRFSGSPENLDAMLQQMVAKAMSREVNRDDLRAEKVKFNGRDVRAIYLPSDAA
ncbi:MAG: hypothetical protein K8R91_02230 [Phycisphaerae bacterium]|nr:hypothetical protein [Phycisphaerae bacterium]